MIATNTYVGSSGMRVRPSVPLRSSCTHPVHRTCTNSSKNSQSGSNSTSEHPKEVTHAQRTRRDGLLLAALLALPQAPARASAVLTNLANPKKPLDTTITHQVKMQHLSSRAVSLITITIFLEGKNNAVIKPCQVGIHSFSQTSRVDSICTATVTQWSVGVVYCRDACSVSLSHFVFPSKSLCRPFVA